MRSPLVLVHGAWQGGWTFDALLPHLAAEGITSIAVDLPGNGHDTTPAEQVTLDVYTSHLAATIDDLGGSAVIVGHSGGGLIATATAERFPERVDGVVYLAGMCLPNGMDFGELQEQIVGEGNVFGVSGDIEVSEDGLTSTVSTEAALRYFVDDIPEPVASQAAAKLTPQPEGGRLISSPTTDDNFGSIPKLYIEALQDKSMILEAQRAMQALIPEMPVVSMDCGHVPQLADPERLAQILTVFLDAVDEYT